MVVPMRSRTRPKPTTIKNWPQRLAGWMGGNNIPNPAAPAKGVK